MSNILLARIDDRLIHGQVMTSWVRFVKSKNILIIDDETYHDAFIRSFITMVVPRGIQIQVLDTKSGISFPGPRPCATCQIPANLLSADGGRY